MPLQVLQIMLLCKGSLRRPPCKSNHQFYLCGTHSNSALCKLGIAASHSTNATFCMDSAVTLLCSIVETAHKSLPVRKGDSDSSSHV